MNKVVLKTKILPEAQKELWPLLRQVPENYVLYGGTAIALRYGHRESVDFDFFSTKWTPYMLDSLSNLSFIKKFSKEEPEEFISERFGQSVTFKLNMTNKKDVDVTFVESAISIPGALKAPDVAIGNKILIASADDLMATKVHTLGKRVKIKDFIDIKEMIKRGQSLAQGFAAAMRFRQKTLEKDFPVFEQICKFLQNPDELKNMLTAQNKDMTTLFQKHIPEIIETIPAAARKINLEREKENSKSIQLSRDLTCGIRRERQCQER